MPVAEPDTDEVVKKFTEAVNMSPGQFEKWLDTDESKSVGHHSGRQIVEILRKKRADYTEEDIAQMRRVIGYIHRHMAQCPGGDVTETHWRYSLMNWGHDPAEAR